jgi:HK97 family phage major capsid protein
LAPRLEEIRFRMDAIRTETEALEKVESSDEDTEQVEEARVRARALFDEFDELAEEIKPLEEDEARRAAIREASRERQNLERTDPNTYSPTRRDPFEDLDAVRAGTVSGADLRARARVMIEQFAERHDHFGIEHDAAERMTWLVDKCGARFGTNIARQMLETSSPEYLEVFQNYMSDPVGWARRAAMSLTVGNGGYLVPTTLDPSIILTNAGSANPYRRVCTVKTTTTNFWSGVTSAGVNAEWIAENTEAADGSPTVGTLKITPQKADVYVVGSLEIESDSDIGQQLPDLLADAKDRIEETAFAVGTGTGQPKGVIPAGTSQSAHSGSAAAGLNAADVYALLAALPPRFRGPRARPVWVMALPTINDLRNVASFTGSFTSIVNDNGPTPSMLGLPILESGSVVSAHANGNKVAAVMDATQYFIVDRVGMSVLYDPMPIGTNFRPMGQGAWYSYWRVGGDAAVATAIRVSALLT